MPSERQQAFSVRWARSTEVDEWNSDALSQIETRSGEQEEAMHRVKVDLRDDVENTNADAGLLGQAFENETAAKEACADLLARLVLKAQGGVQKELEVSKKRFQKLKKEQVIVELTTTGSGLSSITRNTEYDDEDLAVELPRSTKKAVHGTIASYQMAWGLDPGAEERVFGTLDAAEVIVTKISCWIERLDWTPNTKQQQSSPKRQRK
jgi:hypothetical protein